MVARDAACLAMQWLDYEGATGDRPVLRFPTQDVDALSEEFAGVVDRTELTDTSWGTREFQLVSVSSVRSTTPANSSDRASTSSPTPAGAHVSSMCAILTATACSSTSTCNSASTSMRFHQ